MSKHNHAITDSDTAGQGTTQKITQVIFPSYAFPNTGERIIVDGKNVGSIKWSGQLSDTIDVFSPTGVLITRVNPLAISSVAYVS